MGHGESLSRCWEAFLTLSHNREEEHEVGRQVGPGRTGWAGDQGSAAVHRDATERANHSQPA